MEEEQKKIIFWKLNRKKRNDGTFQLFVCCIKTNNESLIKTLTFISFVCARVVFLWSLFGREIGINFSCPELYIRFSQFLASYHLVGGDWNSMFELLIKQISKHKGKQVRVFLTLHGPVPHTCLVFFENFATSNICLANKKKKKSNCYRKSSIKMSGMAPLKYSSVGNY